jgi:hypothetical protein
MRPEPLEFAIALAFAWLATVCTGAWIRIGGVDVAAASIVLWVFTLAVVAAIAGRR